MPNDQDASNLIGATAPKRKYRDDDIEADQVAGDSLESSETPSVSYSFKKPQNRVARRTSVSEDGDKHNTSSGSSKYHNNKYQDRPRDEAQPLGKKRCFPPNPIRQSRREERGVIPRPSHQQQSTLSNANGSYFQENHDSASSNPNDETIPLPIPGGKCVNLLIMFIYYLFELRICRS